MTYQHAITLIEEYYFAWFDEKGVDYANERANSILDMVSA